MGTDFRDFRRHVRGRADHLRELIIAHGERLQLLELQQALYGALTDPAVIIQINDIRTELERLRRDLVEAQTDSGILKSN